MDTTSKEAATPYLSLQDSFNLQWVEMAPPGQQLAKHTISGHRLRMAQTVNIRKRLTQEWDNVHAGLKHQFCTPLGLTNEGMLHRRHVLVR